jgi:hypothetical protein
MGREVNKRMPRGLAETRIVCDNRGDGVGHVAKTVRVW